MVLLKKRMQKVERRMNLLKPKLTSNYNFRVTDDVNKDVRDIRLVVKYLLPGKRTPNFNSCLRSLLADLIKDGKKSLSDELGKSFDQLVLEAKRAEKGTGNDQ